MASSDEKAALMQLIMEHLDAEGMGDVKAVIQKKAAEKYGVAVASPVKGSEKDKGSRLVGIVGAVLKDTKPTAVKDEGTKKTATTTGDSKGKELVSPASASVVSVSSLLTAQNTSLPVLLGNFQPANKMKTWEEPSDNIIFVDNDGVNVKGASIGKLIELYVKACGDAATDGSSADIMGTIYIIYTTASSYSSPEEIIYYLLQLYEIPKKNAKKLGGVENVKVGVAHFLKKWLAGYMAFYRQNKLRILLPLAASLTAMFDPTLVEELQLPKWLDSLSNRLVKGIALSTDAFSEPIAPGAPPPLLGSLDIYSIDLQLTDVDPKEVARQITIVDSFMYRNIPPYEWLQKSWSSPRYEHKAEHTREFIDRFNALNLFVTTEVLSQSKVNDRVAKMRYFIEVAKELRKLNNLNSTCAVAAGLDVHAVKRMTLTQEALGEKDRAELASLNDIFSAQGRYKNYRYALSPKSLPKGSVLIPHLAIHLSDLTFTEDGNPNKLEGTKLINFEKWELLARIIFELRNYQKMKFELQPVRSICNLITRNLKTHYHYFEEDRTTVSKNLKTLSNTWEPDGAMSPTVGSPRSHE